MRRKRLVICIVVTFFALCSFIYWFTGTNEKRLPLPRNNFATRYMGPRMSGHEQNIIFGVIDSNVKKNDVKRFIQSLRESRCDADVILFSPESRTDIQRILNYYRYAKIITHEFNTPFHNNMKRFLIFMADRYIKNYPDTYKKVLISDVWDVIFQRDPFDLDTYNGIVIHTEGHIPIGNCAYHTQWIRSNYGEVIFQKLKCKKKINSGAILIDAAHFTTYTKLTIEEFFKSKEASDQTVMTYLVYTGKIKKEMNVTIHNIEHGSYASIATYDASINTYGDVVNNDDVPYALIHQWDEHPGLKGKVKSRYPDMTNQVQYAGRQWYAMWFINRNKYCV
jgi:hypothetical protein